MPYRLARFISILFHPVLMPTYSLVLLFGLSGYFSFITSSSVKEAVFAIVIFNTLVMPLFISWLLYRRGLIKSLEMDDRQERILPFLFTAVLIMLAYYMLLKLGLPRIFYVLLLGAAGSVVLAVLITLKWKISIHMIGIGGITGMFFALSTLFMLDFRIPVLISLIVAGIIGVARLSISSHQQMQIYAGFFVGFLCEYLVLQSI